MCIGCNCIADVIVLQRISSDGSDTCTEAYQGGGFICTTGNEEVEQLLVTEHGQLAQPNWLL